MNNDGEYGSDDHYFDIDEFDIDAFDIDVFDELYERDDQWDHVGPRLSAVLPLMFFFAGLVLVGALVIFFWPDRSAPVAVPEPPVLPASNDAPPPQPTGRVFAPAARAEGDLDCTVVDHNTFEITVINSMTSASSYSAELQFLDDQGVAVGTDVTTVRSVKAAEQVKDRTYHYVVGAASCYPIEITSFAPPPSATDNEARCIDMFIEPGSDVEVDVSVRNDTDQLRSFSVEVAVRQGGLRLGSGITNFRSVAPGATAIATDSTGLIAQDSDGWSCEVLSISSALPNELDPLSVGLATCEVLDSQVVVGLTNTNADAWAYQVIVQLRDNLRRRIEQTTVQIPRLLPGAAGSGSTDVSDVPRASLCDIIEVIPVL